MRVVGVVAEFDPFHNGHEYLLNTAKKLANSKYAVAVLGGDFSQRGSVSMLSKAAKTECAVTGGFDLVLELPTTFALASAERFASGGVSVLAASGVVTHIAFGSECGDIDLLKSIADVLLRPETVDAIKLRMKNGVSFAAAREMYIGEMLGKDARIALRSPNDILGAEYVKAIKKLKADITPVAVKRVGAGHTDKETDGKFASATAIRALIQSGGDASAFLPQTTADVIAREREDGGLRVVDDRVILSRLRAMSASEISRLPEVREGVENRVKEAAQNATDFDSFVAATYSRRYTAASVRRIALNALLGIDKTAQPQSIEYVRILGANADASDLLKAVKQNCSLPLITKPADSRGLLKTECTASDTANMFAKKPKKGGDELRKFPFLKKN